MKRMSLSFSFSMAPTIGTPSAQVDTGVVGPRGSVRLRGGRVIQALHSWTLGGFGELIHDVPVDATPAELRKVTSAGLWPEACTLLLTSIEAFYLSHTQQPPRLRLARPAENELSASHLQPPGGEGSHAMSDVECWRLFCAIEPLFPQLYAAYCQLRDAGWHIRDGVKFGADFVLYDPKLGPKAHAVHSVLVLAPLHQAERTWVWLQRHV